jgi:hypothetical protein
VSYVRSSLGAVLGPITQSVPYQPGAAGVSLPPPRKTASLTATRPYTPMLESVMSPVQTSTAVSLTAQPPVYVPAGLMIGPPPPSATPINVPMESLPLPQVSAAKGPTVEGRPMKPGTSPPPFVPISAPTQKCRMWLYVLLGGGAVLLYQWAQKS